MAKPKEREYNNKQKEDFNAQIDSLTEINEYQKTYLRSRWLEQMLWLSSSSNKARDNYYRIKRLTILSGVLIPVLIGSNFGTTVDTAFSLSIAGTIDDLFKIIAIILGLLVAAANGLNEFFKYHERWQNYRTSAELLKAEWWYYYSLTGRYEGGKHEKAFDDFAERVENTLRQDLKTYIATVTKESTKKQQDSREQNG